MTSYPQAVQAADELIKELDPILGAKVVSQIITEAAIMASICKEREIKPNREALVFEASVGGPVLEEKVKDLVIAEIWCNLLSGPEVCNQ